MIYLASPYSYSNGPVSLQTQIKHARFKMVEFQTYLFFQQKCPVFSPIVTLFAERLGIWISVTTWEEFKDNSNYLPEIQKLVPLLENAEY